MQRSPATWLAAEERFAVGYILGIIERLQSLEYDTLGTLNCAPDDSFQKTARDRQSRKPSVSMRTRFPFQQELKGCVSVDWPAN